MIVFCQIDSLPGGTRCFAGAGGRSTEKICARKNYPVVCVSKNYPVASKNYPIVFRVAKTTQLRAKTIQYFLHSKTIQQFPRVQKLPSSC
jgi:hypothetical protein